MPDARNNRPLLLLFRLGAVAMLLLGLAYGGLTALFLRDDPSRYNVVLLAMAAVFIITAVILLRWLGGRQGGGLFRGTLLVGLLIVAAGSLYDGTTAWREILRNMGYGYRSDMQGFHEILGTMFLLLAVFCLFAIWMVLRTPAATPTPGSA